MPSRSDGWGNRTVFPTAAVPGTSSHGFGAAVDFSGMSYAFGTAVDQWLAANGKAYGWDRPPHLDRYGSNPECWHCNFIG